MKSTKVIITALAVLFFVNVSYMEARAETSSSAEVAEEIYQEVPPLQISQFETQIETAPPVPAPEDSPADVADAGGQETADGPGMETLTASEESEEKAGGTSIGEQVVAYASQFIGNPYVYGGTSLTKGADCSGFVMRVYEQFGVSLPRTSKEQGKAGTDAGGLENAHPGDLVSYKGHIGIYDGQNQLVHASNPKNGITVSPVNYKPILSVRCIV